VTQGAPAMGIVTLQPGVSTVTPQPQAHRGREQSAHPSGRLPWGLPGPPCTSGLGIPNVHKQGHSFLISWRRLRLGPTGRKCGRGQAEPNGKRPEGCADVPPRALGLGCHCRVGDTQAIPIAGCPAWLPPPTRLGPVCLSRAAWAVGARARPSSAWMVGRLQSGHRKPGSKAARKQVCVQARGRPMAHAPPPCHLYPSAPAALPAWLAAQQLIHLLNEGRPGDRELSSPALAPPSPFPRESPPQSPQLFRLSGGGSLQNPSTQRAGGDSSPLMWPLSVTAPGGSRGWAVHRGVGGGEKGGRGMGRGRQPKATEIAGSCLLIQRLLVRLKAPGAKALCDGGLLWNISNKEQGVHEEREQHDDGVCVLEICPEAGGHTPGYTRGWDGLPSFAWSSVLSRAPWC